MSSALRSFILLHLRCHSALSVVVHATLVSRRFDSDFWLPEQIACKYGTRKRKMWELNKFAGDISRKYKLLGT